MKANNFLLSKTTSSIPTKTNTSLIRAFAVFISILLGYGSLNAQIISTIAGNGTNSSTGDGGLATAATTNTNSFITTHTNGDIYIVEQNITGRRVRKIEAASGIITTVCGTGITGFSGDGGLATSATLDNPSGVAIDASGNIYISDTNNNRIRKITVATGIISTICGDGTNTSTGDTGFATAATTAGPASLFFDATGNLYFTEVNGSKVRKITPTGIITTICGTGTASSTGDGGLATAATLNAPWGGAIDNAGNIYIAETNSHKIRKITASTGIISTICNSSSIASSSGDGGFATVATLNLPYGVCVDKTTGDLYISEFSGNRVRKITASTGIISRVCGTGVSTSTGDGGLATAATVNAPVGVHYANNKLYIGENQGHRIRAIDFCPTITINPGTLISGTVGTAYTQTLTQTGLTTPTWTIISGTLPTGLTLIPTTGVISGTPTAAGTFTFTISITEGGCSQSRSYSIVVTCPTITISPSPSLAFGTLGIPYSQALTQTGLTGTLTWSIFGGLPAGLTLDTFTGIISGTPTGISSPVFTITVGDGSGCTGTESYLIIIDCPILTFNNTTVDDAFIGTPYSLDASVTGNTGLVTYSVSPSLPPGLSIDIATGIISGTPTTITPPVAYTVTATQGTCSPAPPQDYVFEVMCPTITISPVNSTLPNGTVGIAYSETITQTGLTGTPSWSISAGLLPDGCSLNPATGIISGTPITAGIANFTIIVTDGICPPQGNFYSIDIACPALIFTNTVATNASVGNFYILNAGVTGNTASVAHSISPVLPTGLNMDPSTGIISGTPFNASSPVTYTVTATQGTCSVTQNYTFGVNVFCGTITITPASLSNGTVGIAYTQALAQTGLSGMPAWSVTGTLPNGLLIDGETGVISGTPTTAGTFTFDINISDGTCSQASNYTIVISGLAPNVPSIDIVFVATTNNVIFSWTAVPNATSYEVRTSTTITNSSIVWNASTPIQIPSTNPSTFSFITNKDNIVYDVTTYYSVRALGSNGASSAWSSTTSIFVSSYNNAVTTLNNDLSTQISIFPNPTNGVVVVLSDVLKEKCIKFVLIDAMGKVLLKEQTINGLPYEINLDNIANGLYYLKIIEKDNVSIKKIVKR